MGNEWQPIETAEKTTQSRLVWCPERKNVYCAYWGTYWTDDDDSIASWMVFGGHNTQIRETPTHWMPLPFPPTGEG